MLATRTWQIIRQAQNSVNRAFNLTTKHQMATSKRQVYGGRKNFWIYSEDEGYDITHPPTPDAPPIYPRISVETSKDPVTFDPAKTALVVIDLQNYFLSPLLGRPKDAVGMKVVDMLLKVAIPACRKADIPIIWLGFGLTEAEVETMPPTIVRGFAADTNFSGPKKIGPFGTDIGPIETEDGSVIEGGRVLMKGSWNAETYAPLGQAASSEDLFLYKNRISGFWGGAGVEQILEAKGIRTLLFAGCNTDQCVAGSMQGAFNEGWDCLMLSDACATWSPEFARKCIEYNMEIGQGFVMSCRQFEKGVENMQKK